MSTHIHEATRRVAEVLEGQKTQLNHYAELAALDEPGVPVTVMGIDRTLPNVDRGLEEVVRADWFQHSILHFRHNEDGSYTWGLWESNHTGVEENQRTQVTVRPDETFEGSERAAEIISDVVLYFDEETLTSTVLKHAIQSMQRRNWQRRVMHDISSAVFTDPITEEPLTPMNANERS